MSPSPDPHRWLPPDDPLRQRLHDEAHARPAARLRMPALVLYVAVRHDGIERSAQWQHLKRLPGQEALPAEALEGQFLRLRLPGGTLRWERHTEFTRYTLVQALPAGTGLGTTDPPLMDSLIVERDWVGSIPGQVLVAIELVMLHADIATDDWLVPARQWFGGRPVAVSRMGRDGHSAVMTDFLLAGDGFERILVVAPPGTSETRAGRISQRLLEMETYRLMALLGLPAAKALLPEVAQAEQQLSALTARFEAREASDQTLLDELVQLAARLERATAEYAFRFDATQAYDALMQQRLAELRESYLHGQQTLGEFLQRRQAPAVATVAAAAQRMASLATRVERASGLLRTRVDIATETQNQQLLARLAQGQALQLRLQATVEGLSIAAISYYVVSLLLYGAKGAQAAGLPLNPEVAVGALLPLVVFGVWRSTRSIQARLARRDDIGAGRP
ncbi:MAG: DUF3422 domain-containing protein [Burkholderiaceae bacterium]|jgi:uncharacterized membrane-anchored protein|nr:DUF3422 domain-containing protein [Burkholderiaceae bacterium]